MLGVPVSNKVSEGGYQNFTATPREQEILNSRLDSSLNVTLMIFRGGSSNFGYGGRESRGAEH